MEHQTPSGFPGNFRKRKVLGTLWFPSGLPETLGKAKGPCPPLGGNTEKWDPPDGPCFHTEREELSLSFQTLQKSLKNIKMVQNGDRKTPAPQRSRLLSSQMRQVRPL